MKKKTLKIILYILVALIILSPFILYLGIFVANNSIANQVEKELKAYPLPDETVLVESLSIAGKLIGNGNGMQYLGAILITSDRSLYEIEEHYKSEFEYIEVLNQNSEKIESISPYARGFNKFDAGSNETYYAVLCWGPLEEKNSSLSPLLDFDLRGH